MWKSLQVTVKDCLFFIAKVWNCLTFIFKKQVRAVSYCKKFLKIKPPHYYLQARRHRAVKYELSPLSPISRHRLNLVRRKVLVLDLDETLIHSHHDGVMWRKVKPGTLPDFVLKVNIDNHPVKFFVHKRPHVDFFLSVVSLTMYNMC